MAARIAQGKYHKLTREEILAEAMKPLEESEKERLTEKHKDKKVKTKKGTR